MLMQHAELKALQQSHPLASSSFQLLIYMVAGVGAPLLLWLTLRATQQDYPFINTTIPAVVIACLVSWYTLMNLRIYAKSRYLSYVLPVNFLAFALISGAILTLRVPYSLWLLSTSFVSTTATSYVLAAMTRLGSKPQYIVPGGKVSELKRRPSHMHVVSIEELERLIDGGNLGGSLVGDLHFDHSAEFERLFAKAALRGIPVYHYRQILELETGQVRIDRLSENVLGSLIPNLPYMALKRFLDIAGVIVLLPLLAPIMGLIALAIRLDSRGPVLFIQDRMGFRGQTFRMVKFRTMRQRKKDSCSLAQRDDAMTRDDDDRITRIGRFLRKMRLDELPQAWNILKGEMSWIGPRPEAIRLSEWYESELPFYSYRHIVRPGLTGWAQVNQGHVTDLDAVNAKLRYDFYYVKNISHWLDMLIALKTIRVIAGGFGAR
jgi:exopolysaccharide biosynthesis polyprenyl glycosylphosphotransferase